MKTKTLYKNNGRTMLAANITAGATTIPVVNINVFPTPVAEGDHFYVTLQDTTYIEIVKVGGVSGSNLTGCVRGQGGTTARAFSSSNTRVENRLVAENIAEFARKNDRMRDIGGLANLTDPSTMDGNSMISTSETPSGGRIIVLNQGTKWSFPAYPITQLTGTVASGATLTTLPITDANKKLTDNGAAAYLIQFTSGPALGVCRLINSITSSAIGWGTDLPVLPGVGSSFEIYRFVGKKMSDKVDRLLTLPDDFDAPVDGVTSANAALTAALQSGRMVDGCGLTYKITSPISISGIGSKLQNCTLDISAIAAGTPYSPVWAITIAGTAGTAQPLTANHTGSNNYFQVADNSSFVDDGYIQASSNDVWATLPDGVSTLNILCKVWRTSGSNQVILRETRQYDFLTADNASIVNINMVDGVIFRNVQWIGAAALGGFDTDTGAYVAQSGLKLQRCVNPQIQGGGARGINGIAYQMWNCWGGKIDTVDIQRGRTSGSLVNNHEDEMGSTGIEIAGGSTRCMVDNVCVTDMAVAVAINGYDRVCRYNTISNLVAASIRQVGVFVCASSDYTDISGCHIELISQPDWTQYTHGTGIYARGNRVRIRGNTVTSPAMYGILYEARSVYENKVDISHNMINCNAVFNTCDAAIMVRGSSAANQGEISGFTISNNIAEGKANHGIKVIAVQKGISNGSITDNQFGDLQCLDYAVWLVHQTPATSIHSVHIKGGVYNSDAQYVISLSSDGSGSEIFDCSVSDVILNAFSSPTAGILFQNTNDCAYYNVRLGAAAGVPVLDEVNAVRTIKDGYYILDTTYDFPSRNGGEELDVVFVVPGAKVGSPVSVVYEGNPDMMVFTPRVSSDGAVTVTIQPAQDNSINLPSATVRIFVAAVRR